VYEHVSFLCLCCIVFFFFFSSRRRHTRFSRDWSSDVCSSDLFSRFDQLQKELVVQSQAVKLRRDEWADEAFAPVDSIFGALIKRSEERRVGKECRSRRSPYD